MNNKELAYPHAIRDIVSEYKYKSENLAHEIEQYEAAHKRLNHQCSVSGGAGQSFIHLPYLHESNGQKLLLASAWRALYLKLNLDRVFSSKDDERFQRSLENPPELTLENLKATFGDYYENPRYYILKGLADVFCSLDKFYKSHSNFGVGKKGLPKRIIVPNFVDGHYGRDKLIDVCKALLQVTGEAFLKNEERGLINDSSFNGKDFALDRLGLSIKIFGNGNAHVHFSPRALNTVNSALHEFYGEVLPDESGEKPDKKQESTEVSKDLQFYRTPVDVVDRIISGLYLSESDRVLEPSCGDGAILDGINKAGAMGYGIEYDTGRAYAAREKGHSVFIGNFLECEPEQTYDYVIMNPPFYGLHYLKHVNHAIKFLKPNGMLIAILPANAWYSHKKLDGRWQDLPVGSFRESGTNVNTGFITIRNR